MENSKQGFEGKTFLIVEDDPVSSEFLKEVFDNMNVELVFAQSGEEAVTIFKENSGISLILMDIRLPGQNGYVTTKKIREMDSEVPIIAQTAYALEGDNQRALEAGCNDYIAKPIRPSLLLEKVKGLF
jgi:CheY-like chemotaxis protein